MTLLISFLFGKLARIEKPRWFAQWLIFWFKNHFKISYKEAKKKNFSSLYSMFTREISRDVSHLGGDSFIHPVDGKLVSSGRVKGEQVFLVKGKPYSLKELVGGGNVEIFQSHYFYNYYLSPQDYHRVHHPVSGVYTSCTLIQGALYPVAEWFVKLMPSVFSKNARTVSIIRSDKHGIVGMVMVGALNVGSLEMSKGLFQNGNFKVGCGDHLGTFALGSSVVMFSKEPLLKPQAPFKVRFGNSL